MEFLQWLQDTSLAQWVSGSESLLSYPTILVLHTIGFSVLVGANAVIDMRLLGIGRRMPLAAMDKLFLPMWIGLVINAITGSLLFIADAVHKSHQAVFYIKLGLIVLALLVLRSIRSLMTNSEQTSEIEVQARGKILSLASLILWFGATTAGRLMAYIG